MRVLSKVGGLLSRHKKAEEHAAEAVGIAIGWRALAYVMGAGVAAAAIAVPTLIDLSNNNGASAAQAISAPGVKAVEAKATEGLGFRDSLYPVFRSTARKYHRAFGGYLFIHPDESGAAQADYFLAYAHPRRGDIEPVVDSEMGSPCSSASTTLAALHELQRRGFQPILYSNTYWLENLRTCAPALEAFPVWEAEYGPELTRVPGFRVIAWQYTDNSGVKGLRVDGSHLLVPVRALEWNPAKPLTPAQKAARALARRKAELRALQGRFWLWRAWRDSLGAFKGLPKALADTRPHVRRRPPPVWWEHLSRLEPKT